MRVYNVPVIGFSPKERSRASQEDYKLSGAKMKISPGGNGNSARQSPLVQVLLN